MIETPTPVEKRIVQLLEHLNIDRAHFAARMFEDWHGLVAKHPERIASFTLVCPRVDPELLAPLASRLLVFSGDQPSAGTQAIEAMVHLPEAQHAIFSDYSTFLWTDMIRDHTAQIGDQMIEFARGFSIDADIQGTMGMSGEVADITYEIFGQGEPLILLPLGLAPSNWDPLLDYLSQHFCVIALGGAELGMLPVLEHRGQSPGYLKMLRNMLENVAPQPGDSVLDVGSGTGVIERWLVQETQSQNPITGLDLNDYLLKEAGALAIKAGVAEQIAFTKGNAEAIPFPDASFDVIFSTTVMEEVDADQMLAEMIRVAKPGGRIGVIVRAMDMPYHINIPVDPEFKAGFEFPKRPGEGLGCASASLYRRFQNSSLSDVWYSPQLAVFTNPHGVTERFIQGSFRSQLSNRELTTWEAAIAQATDEGTFYVTWPHHCAVGRKT